MIVVDSSAWVEYLRGTGSPTGRALRTDLSVNGVLGVVDLVRRELGPRTRSS